MIYKHEITLLSNGERYSLPHLSHVLCDSDWRSPGLFVVPLLSLWWGRNLTFSFCDSGSNLTKGRLPVCLTLDLHYLCLRFCPQLDYVSRKLHRRQNIRLTFWRVAQQQDLEFSRFGRTSQLNTGMIVSISNSRISRTKSSYPNIPPVHD